MGKRKGEVVLTFKKSGFLFENIEKQRSKERPVKLEMFVHTQARPRKDFLLIPDTLSCLIYAKVA